MRCARFQENLSKSVMQALEARVAKLEVQVQTSVSRSLNKHVNSVGCGHGLGSDVALGRETEGCLMVAVRCISPKFPEETWRSSMPS